MYLTIGEKIMIYRHRKNMSIAQLAKLVGVSEATISNYEHDKVSIGMDKIMKICAALDVPIDMVIDKKAEEEESFFPED